MALCVAWLISPSAATDWLALAMVDLVSSVGHLRYADLLVVIPFHLLAHILHQRQRVDSTTKSGNRHLDVLLRLVDPKASACLCLLKGPSLVLAAGQMAMQLWTDWALAPYAA